MPISLFCDQIVSILAIGALSLGSYVRYPLIIMICVSIYVCVTTSLSRNMRCFRLILYISYPSPAAAAAAAKLLQLCPTLCDPIDDSPPGSPVPGILQARTLEWVAIP